MSDPGALEERLSQLEKLVQAQSDLLTEAKQQTAILAGATQTQNDHMQNLKALIEGALGKSALTDSSRVEPPSLGSPDEDPSWRHCSVCNTEWQEPPDRCSHCRIKGGRGKFIPQVDYTPATWNDHGSGHTGSDIAFGGGASAAPARGGTTAPPFGLARPADPDRVIGTSPCAQSGRHTDGHATYTMEQMTNSENGESWANSLGGKNCQQSWNISIHMKKHPAETWYFHSVRTKANLQYTMACRCCGQYATCYAGYADIKDVDRIDRTFEEYLGLPHIPGHQEQVDARRLPVQTAPPAPWTSPIGIAPPEPWFAPMPPMPLPPVPPAPLPPLPPPSEPFVATRKAPPPAPPATVTNGSSYSGWGGNGSSAHQHNSGFGHTPPHAGPGTGFMPLPTPLPAGATNEYSSECHV
jgi:hypothetical protein